MFRLFRVPDSDSSIFLSRLAAISFLLVIATAPCLAEEGNTESSWKKKFQLHGHLTTSYAESSPSGAGALFAEEAQLGIPEDGTFDYRIAALQLRYKATDRHTFLIQLSHRKLGDSILNDLTDDVELDWLYWQWQLADSTRLRVGRFATAAGIFNEVRDVGTLLPFFRPSFNFYREGSLFSETVDGIGVSHRFMPESDWALDADLYYGEYEILEQGTGLRVAAVEVDVTDAVGTQLWLNTPYSGLRLGVGAQRWDAGEESQFNVRKTTWKSWYTSLDGNFERFVVRGEYRKVETTFISPPFILDGEAILDLYYWQLGWKPTTKLSFYVQSEHSDIEQVSAIYLGGSTKHNSRRDEAVAINYAFRPNIVFKAEYHEQHMDLTNSFPVFTAFGLRLDARPIEFENDYSIVSLSLSF